MSTDEKRIILIENNHGEFVPYGWWQVGIDVIHPYQYGSKSDAMKAALELPKDSGNCKILSMHEYDDNVTGVRNQ